LNGSYQMNRVGLGLFLGSKVIVFSVAMGIMLIGVAAPFFNGVVGYPSGERFYEILSGICHQRPTDCFWFFGQPMALCTRCTGGYLGVSLAAVLFTALISRVPRAHVYAASITIFMLAVIEAIVHLSSDNIWRFASGLVGGVGASLAFLCVLHWLTDAVFWRRSAQLKAN